MPWCTPCDRFLSPSTVKPDGTCPSCGRVVDPGRAQQPRTLTDPTASDDTPPVPWHLKLLLLALAIYLAYRLFQGVQWLVIHL